MIVHIRSQMLWHGLTNRLKRFKSNLCSRVLKVHFIEPWSWKFSFFLYFSASVSTRLAEELPVTHWLQEVEHLNALSAFSSSPPPSTAGNILSLDLIYIYPIHSHIIHRSLLNRRHRAEPHPEGHVIVLPAPLRAARGVVWIG